MKNLEKNPEKMYCSLFFNIPSLFCFPARSLPYEASFHSGLDSREGRFQELAYEVAVMSRRLFLEALKNGFETCATLVTSKLTQVAPVQLKHDFRVFVC